MNEKLLDQSKEPVPAVGMETATSPIALMQKDPDLDNLRKALKTIQIQGKTGLSGALSSCFKQHSNDITSLVISGDGAFMATCSRDFSIHLWNLGTRSIKIVFRYNAIPSAVSLSFNGNYLACGFADKIVKLYDSYRNSEIATFKGHANPVLSVACSQDGKFVTSGSTQGVIKVWNIQRKAEEFSLNSGNQDVVSMKFSFDGKYLGVASKDTQVRVWNFFRRALEYNYRHDRSLICINFSNDSKYVVSGDEDSKIKVFSLSENKELCILAGHERLIYDVSFSPDNKYIASASQDATIKIWNFEEKKEEFTIKNEESIVKAVSFHPQGKYFVSAYSSGCVRFNTFKNDHPFIDFTGFESGFNYLDFNPTGEFLMSTATNGEIKVWNIAKQCEEYTISGIENASHCAKFSPNGLWFGTCHNDSSVKLWNLADRSLIANFTGCERSTYCIAFSSDNKFLAATDGRCTIKVWDISTKVLEAEFFGHTEPALTLEFSPDGRFLAAGANDKFIRIWSIYEKKEVLKLVGHRYSVYSICYMPNGRFLASGSHDGTVRIWNLETGTEEFSFIHGAAVRVVKISSDGRFLFSTGERGIAKVWNLLGRYEEHNFEGFNDNIYSACISPDCKIIAVGTSDKILRLLNVEKLSQDGTPETGLKAGFSPDNTMLVTKSPDNQLKAYSLKTGEEVKSGTFQLVPPTEKSFNPNSILDFEFQNFHKFQTTLRHLENSHYEKILWPNIVFTNLKFSVTHFLAYLGMSDLISKLCENGSLALIPDIYGHLPIYYSIKAQHQETTELLLDHMCKLTETETLSFTKYFSWCSLTKDLPDIIRNSSSILDTFLACALFRQNKHVYFGTPLSTLPMFKNSEFMDSSPNDYAIDTEIKSPLVFKRTPFAMSLEASTNSSIEMADAILSSTNRDIFRTEVIKYYIQYKWSELQFWVYLYTIILWANIILILIFFEYPSIYLAIALLIVNFFLFFWELIQFFVSPIAYITSLMNYLDIFRLGTTIAYAVLILFYEKDYDVLTWFMMTCNLLRGVTGFRAFNNTRYYIRLLSECMYNMKDFLIVFVYTILSLGILNMISGSSIILSFESLWSASFGLVAGKSDNFYDNSIIQHFTFMVAVTINLIIMLNMIISILGDSFDEFQLNAEIYNYSEMLEVIYEAEQLIRVFSSRVDRYGYFHACVHAYNSGNSQWKGKIMDVRDFIRGKFLNEDLKPLVENNRKVVEANINENLGQKIEMVEKNVQEKMSLSIKTVNDRVSGIEGKIGTLEGKMDNLQSSVDAILSLLQDKGSS
ncbi:hypothetical protein SteCoe_10828 [Stentor coeruleus]|uniref:Uncharacterized protein n=1 Tax=Stentor coeruleus TaxID=5963 RepID=A0A1R2CEQ8_9CILI|nr:hypothetical protein SteCoe_10828 [Stentor coeruleus]